MSGAVATEPIAVVGLAGRFPGAVDVRALWRNLCAGVESIRALDGDDLQRTGVPAELARDPRYVRASSDLDGIELFEPAFFGFAPREAAVTDPQQRLLLELAWEALEDACHPPERFDGAVGVYVGGSRTDYLQHVLTDPRHLATLGAFALQVGSDRDFLATRIAYALDLRGPCMTVQTACSTSLVAVHLACQGLLSGECDLALAGGVSIRLPQGCGYLHVEGGVASPDGHCRAFDEQARGTVAGSGGGLVVLRRLEEALADGDAVHAILLGTAVNNDGADKVGFTAPSISGQAAAIEEALAVGGVEPATVGYVEAHGTGTPIGDPIEVAALTRAFGDAPARGSCALGSIKTNLGHLDAAAGVAGLIKAVLAVREGAIPPSLHFEQPNPRLELERTPFRVAARLEPWSEAGRLRRAGVSSFGIGGTNAHVVLEQPPARPPALSGDRTGTSMLLRLSARSEAALERSAVALADRLEEEGALDLKDVAWSLDVGRRAFDHRRAVSASSTAEAIERLRAGDGARGRAREGVRVAFLFPGQGSQHARMGAGLFAAEPVFRDELGRCAEELAPRIGLDLRELLFEREPEEAQALLARTRLTQPALFAVEIALARALLARGVEPCAMLGHSVGELVAACLAGVFDLETGLALVAERGRLMDEQPEGAMLAVALGEDQLAGLLPAGLSLASINGPASCVASGAAAGIEDLEARLGARGIACRRLRTSHAFHSPDMEPAARAFGEFARGFELSPPRIPVLSNVSGTWLDERQATDPLYWAEQIRRPVRLHDGLRHLATREDRVLLEVGPGRTLASLARSVEGARTTGVGTLRHQAAGDDQASSLENALGELWVRGVDLPRNPAGEVPGRRVSLPTTPFDRVRCWIDDAPALPGQEAPGVFREPVQRTPAPEGSVVESVTRVCREVLGVERVELSDSFLDIGGSSLLAIQVAARLSEELAGKVSPADVLEVATIGALAERIEDARCPEAEPLPRPACIELEPEGEGPPLVCVHGIEGEVAPFAPLARALRGSLRTLALRAPGRERGERPLERLEELAVRHVESLRTHRPDGPWILAGHSFGGPLAFEMARVLREQGERVGRLILLDARIADLNEARDDVPALRRDARARLAELAADLSPDELERRVEVVVAHARALRAWRPEPGKVDALLLLAREGAPGPSEREAAAWGRLVHGRLDVRTVAGDHRSMLAAAHVDELARHVAEAAARPAEPAEPTQGGRA